MRMKSTPIVLAVAIATMTTVVMAGPEDDFPLRKKYPELDPISTHELASARESGDTIVIDVRTKGEFEVMHIKGAINIPHILTDEQYAALKSAADKPHRQIVFYCNGGTCAKSYKAAEIAMTQRFKGVRNYDAGIFEWARNFPEQTIFFGQPMTAGEVQEKLIPESDFRKVLVDTFTFIDMAKSGKYQVYDIRDAREKAEYPINLPDMKEATIDQLQELLNKQRFPVSDVLLLDNVGRQVIWAQYWLKKFGVTNYFFLAGGVEQWRADGRAGNGSELGRVFGRRSRK